MKQYVDYSQSPDGWNVSSMLELEDDGRFVYTEGWTDYTNASLYSGARGFWLRDGSLYIFQAESVEGLMYFPWKVGEELKAVGRERTLDFGQGWTLREPPEREVNIPLRSNAPSPKPPAATPPKTSPKTSPALKPPPPASPQVEPLALSPELAARVRRWIEELPTEGTQNWAARLCKENDAIPLHCTQIYLWALSADGQVLSIDHESFARRAEPENKPSTAYAALAQGARKYPELAELLAHNPEGLVECERCGGRGWTEAEAPAEGTHFCHWCDGMGWHPPR
jgi:hypothetical protein